MSNKCFHEKAYNIYYPCRLHRIERIVFRFVHSTVGESDPRMRYHRHRKDEICHVQGVQNLLWVGSTGWSMGISTVG